MNIEEIVNTLNELLKELNEMKNGLSSLQEATRGLMATVDMFVEGAKHRE